MEKRKRRRKKKKETKKAEIRNKRGKNKRTRKKNEKGKQKKKKKNIPTSSGNFKAACWIEGRTEEKNKLTSKGNVPASICSVKTVTFSFEFGRQAVRSLSSDFASGMVSDIRLE